MYRYIDNEEQEPEQTHVAFCDFLLPRETEQSYHYFMKYDDIKIPTGFDRHLLAQEINVTKSKNKCHHTSPCSVVCVRLSAGVHPSSDRQHFDLACVLRDRQNVTRFNRRVSLQVPASSTSLVPSMSTSTKATPAATAGPSADRQQGKGELFSLKIH